MQKSVERVWWKVKWRKGVEQRKGLVISHNALNRQVFASLAPKVPEGKSGAAVNFSECGHFGLGLKLCNFDMTGVAPACVGKRSDVPASGGGLINISYLGNFRKVKLGFLFVHYNFT